MIARAEQGITGSGLHCHSCSGSSNLCTNSSDQGTLIDCGEGVVTCLIATSKLVATQVLSQFVLAAIVNI